MNRTYHLFCAVLVFFSYSLYAKVRNIASYSEFETYVLKPSRGNIIQASITGCTPCENIAPHFEAVSDLPEFRQVGFFSINMNNTPEALIWLAEQRHTVPAYPAFIFVEGGKLRTVETGIHDPAMLKDTIRKLAKQHFSGSPTPSAPSAAPVAPAAEHKRPTSHKKHTRRRRSSSGRSHGRRK